jgi:hypothetical protein
MPCRSWLLTRSRRHPRPEPRGEYRREIAGPRAFTVLAVINHFNKEWLASGSLESIYFYDFRVCNHGFAFRKGQAKIYATF